MTGRRAHVALRVPGSKLFYQIGGADTVSLFQGIVMANQKIRIRLKAFDYG